MALSDIEIKVASQSAVQAVNKYLSPLRVFAHNFSELADKKGSAIGVPVFALNEAAEYNASSNNWGTTQNLDGVEVTLDKHFIKSIGLDDVTNGASDVNLLADGTTALIQNLAHAANKYVYGLINATNISAGTEVELSAEGAFAALPALADAAGVNPYESTLVLDWTNFGYALKANTCYGVTEPMKTGVIEGMYGFRNVIPTSYLPSGTIGAIVPYGTLGVASRVNEPAVAGYSSTFKAVDEASGIAVGLRMYEDLAVGKAVFGADILFGAKILQSGIVRLVNA